MAALTLLSTPALLRAQISPGPLARPHAQLEGARQCVKCHAGGGHGAEAQMTGLCLQCHKEIAWSTERNRGVHGAPKVKAQRCASCHPEHAGRDFAMISWEEGSAERFDHARTGWPLDGSHTKEKCSACHKSAFRVSPVAQLSQRPRTDPGFLGLDRRCQTCHEDVHGGRLGADCSRCHQTTSFKTVNRTSFDHDRTRFPLRGRHSAVSCEKCHDFSAGQVTRSPTFATCAGCHTPDPHAGTATLAGRVVDCASCHSVDGWRPSLYTVAQHKQTQYPLEGRHAQARCEGCHVQTQGTPAGAGGGVVVMRPATTTCVSCHVDPHANRLPRCGDCHDVNGFRPTAITVAEHQQYRFPLTGAHRAVPCAGCHTTMQRPPLASTLKLTAFAPAPMSFTAPAGGCRGCHVDPHGRQFARRPGGGTCESCHDTDAFRPATKFDHDRDAAFSLKGAHAKVPCDRCHKPAPGRVVVYRPVPAACEACHK